MNNDTFYRTPVASAQCIFGTEKCPDSGIFLNYDDDNFFQSYSQTKEIFKALTENDLLQPYIADHDSSSTNINSAGEDDVSVEFNLYVFDKRYQKYLESVQPIKVEFKFSESNLVEIYGFALVLTNKLLNIWSDGQRRFELM